MGAAGYKVERHIRACRPYFHSDYKYLEAEAPTRGRAFLLPGLDGSTREFIGNPTNQSWVDGLRHRSFDVVILDTPIPAPCWWRDGGKAYKAAFLARFDAIWADIQRQHGAMTNNLVAGVSFGGVHALYAFAAHPGRFQAWQAVLPVITPSELAEYRNTPTPDFDARSLRMAAGRGLIVWGTADTRAPWQLAQAFYKGHSTGTVRALPMRDHSHRLTADIVEALVADADSPLIASK